MSEMNLKPSKLSLAANQVWSESQSLFQKKDVKIDLGLDRSTMGNANGASETQEPIKGIASGYVFGSRVADRVTNAGENGDQAFNATVSTTSVFGKSNLFGASKSAAKEGEGSKDHAQPKDVSSIFKQMTDKTKECSVSDLWKKPTTTTSTATAITDADSTTAPANSTTADTESTPASSSEERLKASCEEMQKNTAVAGSDLSATIEVIATGEEDERNLVNISCKFFYFNTESKTWVERGMGTLKINQKIACRDDIRIVGRTTGSQRVVINSKIFAEMMLEHVSDKRIKISALNPDSEIPQLFLIQSSPVSIARVENMLENSIGRAKAVERKKSRTEVCSSSSDVSAASKTEGSTRKRKPEEELDLNNDDWD